MLNPDQLWRRAALIQTIRAFFIKRGYLEVDTPLCLTAPAPEAHIEPQEAGDRYLQTSPELCMKRLLAAGGAKIFQICKCFRKKERGARHLPEFTMLEWYRTNCDYQGLMAEVQELLEFLADRVAPDKAVVNGRPFSWQNPLERLTVAEAFARHAPLTLAQALAGNCFDETLCRYVEPCLGQQRPTILYDYPAALGSLARLKKAEPALAERFELYINGLELANGFSELTDAAEQQARFTKEQALIESLGRQPAPMPRQFLAALTDMPAAAGIALGVDRLAMIFWGASTIDQVVTFTPEEA